MKGTFTVDIAGLVLQLCIDLIKSKFENASKGDKIHIKNMASSDFSLDLATDFVVPKLTDR